MLPEISILMSFLQDLFFLGQWELGGGVKGENFWSFSPPWIDPQVRHMMVS